MTVLGEAEAGSSPHTIQAQEGIIKLSGTGFHGDLASILANMLADLSPSTLPPPPNLR